MTPLCIPMDPQPPAGQQLYTLGDLKTVPAYTLETYRAAFGEDPPDHDPNRRPKYWFDTTPGNGTGIKSYYTVAAGSDGKPDYQSFPLSDEERAKVNIPHDRSYPKWEPKPTNAKQSNMFGGFNPVNVDTLSLLSEANELQAEIAAAGMSSSVSEVNLSPLGVAYPDDEPRRQYGLVFADGMQVLAGEFLKEKYQKGVGAPGRWVQLSTGGPGWVSDAPAKQAAPTLDQVPFPMRRLLPDEAFRMDGFTGMIRVQRGTLAVDAAGFGPGDRSALQGVAANVETVRQMILKAMKG